MATRKKKTKVLVLHGPNLNLLGSRETDVYGTATLASIVEQLEALATELGVEIESFQSNGEGEIVSAATALSSGVAFDVDDGSGPIRVLVMTATGIDTTSWTRGTIIAVVGIVGQRDATGTGTSGYRVQPRGSDDIAFPAPPPTPTPPFPTIPSSPSTDRENPISSSSAERRCPPAFMPSSRRSADGCRNGISSTSSNVPSTGPATRATSGRHRAWNRSSARR